MILTCPHCATRYFVEEMRLGPQGRTVRCAACGQSWRAEAPEPEPLELAPAAEPAPPPASPSADLPKTFRAREEAKRRTRQAVAAGAVWAGLAAGLALLLVCAAVFRVQVVQLWPRTAGAYAALHLPVNPLGLAPDGVQATPDLKDGRAALTVTGAERNIDPGPRLPAPLRISLYDKAGHRLAEQVLRLPLDPIPAGQSRAFRASFIDPPLAGTQVGVDFVFDPRSRPHMARSPAPQLRARGVAASPVPAAAQPARPLPAGSPYALPAAARTQSSAPSNG